MKIINRKKKKEGKRKKKNEKKKKKKKNKKNGMRVRAKESIANVHRQTLALRGYRIIRKHQNEKKDKQKKKKKISVFFFFEIKSKKRAGVKGKINEHQNKKII